MEKFLNKMFGNKFVLFLLRKFSNIESIHFSIIRNFYSAETNIKKEVDNIIGSYNIILDKTKSPKLKEFYFHQYFEGNTSAIIFIHEDK